jgi:hypothetical protein
MLNKINDLDIVKLLTDIPNKNLKKGDKGTIIECDEKKSFVLVEFSDKNGKTKELIDIQKKDLKKVWDSKTQTYNNY